MKTYKRTRTIYVIGEVAFVADPATRSAWWKTHAAVAITACPTCQAPIGQLCTAAFGFHHGSTHGARRRAARGGFPAATKVILQSKASS